MDKNRILSARFLGFSKYLGIVAAISFVVFLIINAFNTGNDILFWISYVLLMLSIILPNSNIFLISSVKVLI